MPNATYKPPNFYNTSFTCPHCNTLAQQKRGVIETPQIIQSREDIYAYMQCLVCKELSLWLIRFHDYSYNEYIAVEDNMRDDRIRQTQMLYPDSNKQTLPDEPNEDMPSDAKELYREARQIATLSPRAAAALLRVALEKITQELGETKGNLNTRIKNLKNKGLPQSVIQSLDIVRITANEGGAHAGQIDLTGKDGEEIVNRLFWLVNFIVEKTISDPRRISEQFQALPEDKKDGIANRDQDITP